jgi:hypothetical protein
LFFVEGKTTVSNLIDPRNATPANDDQRGALRAAYVMLGGAPKARRRTHARSVSVDRLDAGGLDRDLLLWLLFQGHLNHFHECRRRRSAICPAASVVVGPTSSFTLTEATYAFAARFLAAGPAAGRIAIPMGDLTPHYDPAQRIFSWGAHLLKRYRQRLGNQEAILTAAEELQWLKLFDDPLPRPREIDAEARLRHTIGDLNRRQRLHLVQFHVNGGGTQIGWELR